MTDLTRWPLKIAILRSPFTQARLARELDRTESWLSRAIHGLIDIAPVEQEKLAKLLGRPVKELFSDPDRLRVGAKT
jgi:hypothetical protein